MRKSAVKEIPQGYKNSPLGIIPNEWEVKRLGEISQMFSGGTPKSTEQMYFNGEIPFIKSGEINNAKTEQYLSELGLKNSSAKLIERGDLLYALYGATSGECALSKISGAINQAILCIRPTKDVDRYFLLSFLQKGKEYYYNSYLQGGQGNLSADIVKGYKILTPPLPEQRKIAEVLSTWDRAIEKQMLLIEKLELRKKGLMQQLLTGKKRLHGFNGVAWKKVKLDEVTTFLSNNSLSRDNLNTLRGSILNIHYGDVLIKLPTIVNVSLVDLPFINEELNIVSKDFVSEGDIIMADTAEDGTVGKACEVVNVGNNKVVSGLHTILIHPTIAFAPMFLGYYLNSKEYHKQILSIMQGIKVYSITKDALRKTNIKIPPLEEQNAIAEILSVCDNEITLAKQKLDTLRQQKKGLMQVLLTGKKRVEL